MTDSHKLGAVLVAAGCIGVAGFMLMKQRTPSTTTPETQSSMEVAEVVAVTPAPAAAAHRLAEVTTQAELDALLAKKDKPVIVKFSTAWCPPCKAIKPIFHGVAASRGDRAYFAEVDIDTFADKDRLTAIGVQSIPTIVIFKNGAEVGRTLGLRTKKDLEQEFEKAGA